MAWLCEVEGHHYPLGYVYCIAHEKPNKGRTILADTFPPEQCDHPGCSVTVGGKRGKPRTRMA